MSERDDQKATKARHTVYGVERQSKANQSEKERERERESKSKANQYTH